MSDFDYGRIKENGQYERYPVSVRLNEAGEPDMVRPYRDAYRHKRCGVVTRMGRDLALTYATNPGYYGRTFCVGCHDHFLLSEFVWDVDNTPMDE